MESLGRLFSDHKGWVIFAFLCCIAWVAIGLINPAAPWWAYVAVLAIPLLVVVVFAPFIFDF